jgi:hypothetical protein
MRRTLLLLATLTACTPNADLRGLSIESDLEGGRKDGAATVDHAAWGRVLAAAVDEPAGRIDYGAVPRGDLDAALAAYGAVDLKTLPAPEQEALLINAYNAFTVQLIVSQPARPDSIRDLKDPWKEARWTVGGHNLSLDDIEHGLLRPLYKDPRLHFALNCASVGCPPLRAAPFAPATLDAQLDAAARDTLARSGWLRVDGGALHTTKLLDWYGGDFTAEGWSPIAPSKAAWLATFGPPAVRTAVDAEKGDPKIVYVDYDWSLNQRGP